MLRPLTLVVVIFSALGGCAIPPLDPEAPWERTSGERAARGEHSAPLYTCEQEVAAKWVSMPTVMTPGSIWEYQLARRNHLLHCMRDAGWQLPQPAAIYTR